MPVVRNLEDQHISLLADFQATDLRAAPGMVTTLDAAGEGEARRLTVTRYADKAAD